MFMVGALLRFGSIAAWIFHTIAYMGCCLVRHLARIHLFLPTSLLRGNSDKSNKLRFFSCVGVSGCLGCDNKPDKLISSLSKPRGYWKSRNNQASQGLSNPAASATLFEDYYWTTSTCEMDYKSAMQSFGSISSSSTFTQLHDSHGSTNSVNPSEFVNHGLLLWNHTRQKWIGNKKRETKAQQLREPTLSWNATYDSLLSSNKPFRKHIPLGEMVDFLVDIWEQEGMYD